MYSWGLKLHFKLPTSEFLKSCLISNFIFSFSLHFLHVASPRELAADGYRGLQCCLLHKRHILQQKLSAVTSTYAHVDKDPSFFMLEEDMQDCEEESKHSNSSPELSEEEL